MHILVTGAAGSGTSTWARAIAKSLRRTFVEADDYLCVDTHPPYQQLRDRLERAQMLRITLSAAEHAVVAGCIMDWGPEIEGSFSLVVSLYADTDVRLKRLTAREVERHGHVDEGFLQWAAQYDLGIAPGRSLERHEAWLRERTCPVLRLSACAPPGALVSSVIDNAKTLGMAIFA